MPKRNNACNSVKSIDLWCGSDFLFNIYGHVVCVRACACTCAHTSPPGRDVLLFGAKSPSLWVKAACLFIKQAVKSASYRTNATVINLACLLSLTEDYPGAYCWFTEVTDIQPIFLTQQPSKCTRMFAECTQLVHLYLSAFLQKEKCYSCVWHPVVACFSMAGSDAHCCVGSAANTSSAASHRRCRWPK